MTNYDKYQQLLLDLENECRDAGNILRDIMYNFTEYQVRKLSGVELVLNNTANPQNMVKPLDLSIVEIKTKITRVVSRYTKRFPDEMKYLDEAKIRDFQCLPCADILGSAELKTAVNNTIMAMDRKLVKIQDKKRELNKEASNTSARKRALASFYEMGNFRILDSNTKEEEILLSYRRAQDEKDASLKTDYNESVQAELDNISGPFSKLWYILGMETVPAISTGKAFKLFHEYQISLQYPKSLGFCDTQRESLTSESLQRSRQNNATVSLGQADEALKQEETHSSGYGASYLKTASFIGEDKRMRRLIARNVTVNAQNTNNGAMEAKYDNLVKSIEGCNTKTGVRSYVAEIRNLRRLLS